ncbi:ectonucleotide pyrophosphatase/phosphodiesterase [Fodinibius salsisoli]|uniref:Alkaline phosphatase family protein n=1 Tax=Fodinibius salsisoli TaxID=2820877 RepID=A0ABT3PSD0_9BACT|nr:ectonucleotide pyrophosphatase/phosphodiesterase [Fodinibius salsisoli]MCW9708756.1 alkaline phosphatase family protein [Fodinibius salsisoli]
MITNRMQKRYVLCLAAIVLALTFIGCHDQQQTQNSQHKLLLISFDGFRYDYLNKVDTPHFDSLAAGGVQAEGLIPVFPSKTFPNHYAIATGLYPENSGFVGNTMYDPKWKEWYRIRDRKAVEDGKWYGGEPIWNTLEKQGIRTGTMFWVGSEANIQGMHPTNWKKYDGDMPFKARVDTVVKWLSAPDTQAVDFATLYFEHVDGIGHRYGTESDSLKAAIRESDRIMGYLKEQLWNKNLWDNTNILIVSDHGMVDLAADKTIFLDQIIDIADTERIIWGPLTMIQPKEGTEEQVYQALKKKEKHYRVYRKEEIPERYHLKNHGRVTDLVVVADLGYMVLNSKYKEQFVQSLPRATHGYDPAEKKMEALFLAHGPAFKSDTTVKAFQNIHLYELMNHVMGTKSAPNDGSLDSVRVLLR